MPRLETGVHCIHTRVYRTTSPAQAYNFAFILLPSPLVKYSFTASFALFTTPASSTVAGTCTSFPNSPLTPFSNNSFNTRLNVFPLRVFGMMPGRLMKPPRLAMGPICCRKRPLRSFKRSDGGSAMARKAKGTWPFMLSGIPTTATSVTAGWEPMACSIAPVLRRCAATLMMSSLRDITWT